ncbi:MAG TPA: HAD family hydrolase [Sphaerochaeta sp.]|nr:HAD family hydrolase [Sphaerochaeta sp.]
MEKSILVFDLDGTLVDSITDIRLAVEAAVSDLELGPLSDELVERFVGRGLKNTLKGLLAHFDISVDEAELLERLERLMEYYRSHPVLRTRPYAGMEELLWWAEGRGHPLGVLSNKEDGLVKEIVETLFPTTAFHVVRGMRTGAAAKPDPRALDEFRHNDLPMLYIGDSEVDWQFATQAAVPALLVTWGLRPRAELEQLAGARLIDSVDELQEAIDGIQ